MSARHRSIAAGLLAAVAAHPGLAAQAEPAATAQTAGSAAKALLEQGRYWQGRDNSVRAAEAWGRLLQVDPAQPEALYNLGLLELKANRPARAQEYLAQLRGLGTAGLYAAELEQEIGLRSGTKPKDLEQARLLAGSGELDKAVVQYRSVFGNKPPQGKLALEYYGYLGYADGGWQEAQQGMERLRREFPDDPQVALVQAKLLTRNETTRAEGIRQLQKLSARPDIGGDAAESWRVALTWFGVPRPAEAPLFEAYLKAYPKDTEIREQFAKMRTASAQNARGRTAKAAPSPRDLKLASAFKSLEDGDLASAEAGFDTLLQANPNHSDALAGMGVLRLKQDKPDDAVDLLTRAVRQSGSRSAWKPVLSSAQYWSLNAHAEQARARGDLDGAQQQLQQAMKLTRGDDTAETALARVQAERGQLDLAEKTYRGLVARDKNNLIALQGLVNVLARTDRVDEALRLIEPLTPAQQEKIGTVGQLRATQARSAAKAASARGDDGAALRLLEEGLRYDPDEPWLRLDLARLYLKTGATTEARGVVDGLLLTNPEEPGALLASALLSAELREWETALATLDKIQPRDRTQDVLDLQKRVWTQYQASRAIELARAGKAAEAKAILAQLEPDASQNPNMLGALAAAYVDAGDNTQALQLLRQAVGRTTRPDNDLLLQYAAVLIKTEQDAEAAGILRQLQSQNLSAPQQRSFEDLRRLYTVRQADALRQRGKVADAYDVLAPVLAQYPNDPLVVGALARMYSAAGDGAKALSLQKQLLEKDPDNAELLIAAAQTAVQAKDRDYADAALGKALSLQPQNPEVLAGAARVYNSQGKTGKAAEYLKAAIAAKNAAKTQVAVAQAAPTAPAAPEPDSNPFANLPGQTRSNPPTVQAPPPAGAQAIPLKTYDSSPVFGQAPAKHSTPAAYGSAARTAKADAVAPRPAPQAAAIAPAGPSSSNAAASVVSSVRADLTPAPAVSSAPDTSGVPAYRGSPNPAPIAPAVIGVATAPSLPPSPFRRPAPDALARADAESAPQRTLEQELDAIQQARSATVTVGTTVRQHNGAAGMGRMVDVETPITVRFPVGDDKAFIQVTPVSLEAGSVGKGFDASSRFGGGPVAAAAQQQGLVGAAGSQDAKGVGVAVGYEFSGLKLDLGVTPFGFRYQNIVGGARFNGAVDDNGSGGPRLSYGAEVSRRAVTDTVMSFAGVRDRRTGESWGGVTRTGGLLSVGLDYGDYGFYGNGGWYALNGHNVQSNTSLVGGAGAYVHLLRETNRTLTTGLNVTGFAYDKNLGYYTYGNGGYFSPQQFLAVSVPVAWTQRQGRLSYQVKGSVGVQHIKQDGAPYFSDATRQAAAEAAAAANGSQASYAGQSKTGIGYGLALAAEYQLAPKWFLGGNLSLDNARDYRQFVGGVYLRYALEAQTGLVPMPVPGFASPYSNE